jgi:hypothetical protein
MPKGMAEGEGVIRGETDSKPVAVCRYNFELARLKFD